MTSALNRPMFGPTEIEMDEPDEDLQAFIKSLDEAEDEADLNGCVPSDVLRRRLDEAKARGLRERAIDQAAIER